ncbi:hypothetical protein ACPESR_29700 [Nocardia testacea]|uniref:hypothetical protein n=1 Tax=Nocardia testacea TaxID=248551 RepID=UPI003C2C0488
MTLTIGNVEQWQTDHLTAAATHVTTLAGRLDQLTGTAVTETRAMNWSGPAGAAANTRMDTERTRTGAVSAALLKLDTALRAEVTNLIEARNKVLLLRDTARDTAQPPLPAFEVADDGSVGAGARIDYLRRAAGDSADSPGIQRTELGQRLVAASRSPPAPPPPPCPPGTRPNGSGRPSGCCARTATTSTIPKPPPSP